MNNLCGFWTVKQVDASANTGLQTTNLLHISENGSNTEIKVNGSLWAAFPFNDPISFGSYNGQSFEIWRENGVPKAKLYCKYTYYISPEPWQLVVIGIAGFALGFLVALACKVAPGVALLIAASAALGSTLAAKLVIKTQSNSTWMAEEGGAPRVLPGEPPVLEEEEEPVLRRVGGRRG